MLNFLTKTLSLEIVNFINLLKRKEIRQDSFSKSAFVQARMKIKPEVFCHLNQTIINEFYTDNADVKTRFNGMRILAIDGTRLTLPITDELEKIYGATKNQTNTTLVQAKVGILYDLLNKIGIAGVISPVNTDERVQAYGLLNHCKPDDLIIYDRGFGGFQMFYEHQNRNLHFLIRLRLDFSYVVKEFVKSKKKSKTVEVKPTQNADFTNKPYNKNATLKLRLVRVTLPNGTVEVLATSLLDSIIYPTEIFKELYFERWKIETYYDELKNKLKMEAFSGYTNQSILQDFYSTIFVSNIQSIIVKEINDELIKENKSTNKYYYKVNTALSYGFMKNRILELFFTKKDMNEILKELKTLFKQNVIPIRPDRNNPRKIGKYNKRIKPLITKNQKDNL